MREIRKSSISIRAAKYNMKLTYEQRRRARDGIVAQIVENQNALQYMVTLQTKIRPAEKVSLREVQVMNLSQQYRHFQNRLNCELFGVRATRNPKLFCVLSIPIIEGFDKSAYGYHTLHHHVALGNIPEYKCQEHLTKWIANAWRETRYGTSNIDVKVVRDDHKTYITKEILTNEGCGIDWLNISIPIITRQHQ